MNRKLLLLIILLVPFAGFSQSNDIQTLHANAKKFMNQGDYANATIILTRLHREAPFVTDISKDLTLCYYAQGEYERALKVISPYLSKKNADEDAFRYAGMIYQKLNRLKEAEKNYKSGLKIFPESGELHDGYGDLLWRQGDFTAIDQWEKGIKSAPNYPDNYLNAMRYYFASQDGIWSIIYGEIFLNLEPATERSGEAKNILFDSYKKLFTQPDLLSNTKKKSKFEVAYLNIMDQYSDIIARGMSVETLTMIRTRFILDWFKNDGDKFPFLLFDQHKYMLENGMFPSYNQWLFGSSQNQAALKHWIELHPDEYNNFINYLQTRRFRVPDDEYYHK